MDEIRGAIHTSSEVRAGTNYEGAEVVELRCFYFDGAKSSRSSVTVVDRATAARLINQLRRVLDGD